MNHPADMTPRVYRICRRCGVGSMMPLTDYTSLCDDGCRDLFVQWAQRTHPKLWRISQQRKKQVSRVTSLVLEWLLTG